MQILKHYRVTDIVYRNKKWHKKSILAREAGKKLHAHIAKMHKGPGKYVEYPLANVITDTKGNILTTLLGTCDLFWLDGNNLYVVDHKTKTEKDKLYMDYRYADQLTAYGAMIITDFRDTRPPFLIDTTKLKVWFYRRYDDIKEAEKIVKEANIGSFTAKEIIKAAEDYLSAYFDKKVKMYGFGKVKLRK